MLKECKIKQFPKQIAAANMEWKREKGRPRKRWRDEFEDNLNIMGIKTDRQWSETVENGERLC